MSLRLIKLTKRAIYNFLYNTISLKLFFCKKKKKVNKTLITKRTSIKLETKNNKNKRY